MYGYGFMVKLWSVIVSYDKTTDGKILHYLQEEITTKFLCEFVLEL
jgi:hypothetical protein